MSDGSDDGLDGIKEEDEEDEEERLAKLAKMKELENLARLREQEAEWLNMLRKKHAVDQLIIQARQGDKKAQN